MNRNGRKIVNNSSAHRQGIFPGRSTVWFGLLVLIFCLPNLLGKEIDRLLVAVNGTVITEGDLYIVRNLNPLVFSEGNIDPVSRKAGIDSLIDLELIRQELENFSMDPVDESSIETRVQEWRNRLAEDGNIPDRLGQLGIPQSELNSFMKFRISILEFIKFRFGPYARVSQAEIEKYYTDRLTPQLRKSGLALPPLSEVSAEIAENIKNEKINAALDEWILAARSSARIEYFYNNRGSDVSEPANSLDDSQAGATE